MREPFAPPLLSKTTEQYKAMAEMIAMWVDTFSKEWNVSLLCFSTVTIERSQPAMRRRLIGTTGAAMFVELTDATAGGTLYGPPTATRDEVVIYFLTITYTTRHQDR